MRTWTRLIPAVVLVLPLTGSSLRADVDSNSKDIEQLKKDVKDLRDELRQLRKDILDNAAQRNANAEQLRAIHDLLERMARSQEALRIQPGYDPRSVTPGAPPIGAATTATITLRNVYSAPATVRINDQSYFVGPNATRTVPLPVGPFQYSVDVEGYGMVLPPRTEVLRTPGYLIRVYPQP